LAVEGDYGTLVLTDDSGEVLGGRRKVPMRKEKAPAAASRKESGSRSGKGARVPVDLPAAAEPVFLALRAWRAETAKEQGVPAYVVFHDATLREIATRVPATVEELAGIGGVGEAKLAKYAEGVLATLAECGAAVPAPAAAHPAGAVASAASVPASSAPAASRPARSAAPELDEPPFDLDEMDPPPWDEDWQ
ncbi:HRDC domain-containing protein, partial [Streptomyces yangpuensis]